MLVKKKNPDWFPSEKKDLKVDEEIDITDPKSLIINGDVIAIDDTGAEISAYELYGVIVRDERKEFEEYLKVRKQEALKKGLEAEKSDLEAKLKASQEEAPKVEEVSADAEGSDSKVDPASLSWGDLVEKAKGLGVYKVGMRKEEVIAAVKNSQKN